MYLPFRSLFAGAALCFVQAAIADVKPDPSVGNDFAIKNVRVFDGTRVWENTDVIVKDGRITAIGKKLTTANLPVVDGVGKTLLPGLIDAHTHSYLDAQQQALRFGVTTELDMMGDWQRLPLIKKQRESMDQTDQADLYSAGAAVTAPGGHGTQFGTNPPTLAKGADAKAFVNARVAEGSDYVKIIVEDLSAYGSSKSLPTIAPTQVQTSIQAAHAAKRLAVVHVSKLDTAMQVVSAGADGLVHIFADQIISAPLLKLSKQRNAFVVPTLSVIASVAGTAEGAKLAADQQLQTRLSNLQKQTLKQQFRSTANATQLDRALQSVKALHLAGVDILAGTDAGNPGTAHGASMHGELALLVQAGLSPRAALAAATSLPAKRFGLTGRGHIRVGDRADLLLVNGNPTHDILATRAIAKVWKNGYAIDLSLPKQQAAAAIDSQLANVTLISDFEKAELSVAMGFGWQATTDQMAGGASVVALKAVMPGANSSKAAMQISGEIKAGFAYPWSGAMWFPAAQPMQALDYSARTEVVFDVQGDGGRYNVMVFSGESVQGIPVMQSFVANQSWRQVRMKLADFQGADFKQLRGIAITAGDAPHAFQFTIDNFEVR